MTLKIADRVFETTITTGTGAVSLQGPITGFQSFVAGVGSGSKVPYQIDNGTSWECGIGTITAGSPDTLSRDTIEASSNSGAAVNFGAGTKNVRLGFQAKLMPSRDDKLNFSEGFGSMTGTNAYTLTPSIAPLGLNDGASYYGFIPNTNTSSTCTITIGSTTVPIKIKGNDPNIGDLAAGLELQGTYKVATNVFELTSPIPVTVPTQPNVLDIVTSSKTAAYTATFADGLIPCNATGGAFTISIPTPVSNAGRRLIIKKTDATLSQITIIPAAGTIDGKASIHLCTQYETVSLESDGTNWLITNRKIISEWVAYTPTIVGFGTPSGVEAFSRRNGDSLEVRGRLTSGAPTATVASFSLGFAGVNAVTGLTIDTTKVPTQIVAGVGAYGSAQNSIPFPLGSSGASVLNFGLATSSTSGFIAQNGNSLTVSGSVFGFFAAVPIQGWEY